MTEKLGMLDILEKYRKFLIVSLIIFILFIPVFDAFIIQRDRNRNMVYGEIFWQEGLGVYQLNDQDLYYDYGVPSDQLLTGVLNVTYEYPIVALLFFAGLAALEPGAFGPSHIMANLVLVLLVHLNLILFLYLGQSYTEKRWFRQVFTMYYIFGFAFSVAFAKVEPLCEFLLLSTVVLFQQDRKVESFAVLALAAQTKVYPAFVFPVLFALAPLQSLSFFIVSIALFVPMLLSGMSYNSLIAHLLNSPGYARMITNPFYLGLVPMNPLSIIGSLVLVWAVLCAVLEVRLIGPIPVPTKRLRTSSRRSIYLTTIPLVLLVVSWTQVWYYSWFIAPFFLMKSPDDMSKFRYVIVGIWIAHFLGVFLNLEYFLSGPIAEILLHLRLP
ncbi:MAG: hypothetical protein EAX95_15770 [Candidatus Thorarchaeota archaeon]|nr:hypothetical protein [Candidatus Thorarchaeota archaeon]